MNEATMMATDVDADARVERQDALPHDLVDEGGDPAQQEGDAGEDDWKDSKPAEATLPRPRGQAREAWRA